MTNLTPILSDAALAAQRSNNKHKRKEWFDTTITVILIAGLILGAIVFAVFLITCVGIFLYALFEPNYFSPQTVEIVNKVLTHSIAIGGGYAAHIVQNHTKLHESN